MFRAVGATNPDRFGAPVTGNGCQLATMSTRLPATILLYLKLPYHISKVTGNFVQWCSTSPSTCQSYCALVLSAHTHVRKGPDHFTSDHESPGIASTVRRSNWGQVGQGPCKQHRRRWCRHRGRGERRCPEGLDDHCGNRGRHRRQHRNLGHQPGWHWGRLEGRRRQLTRRRGSRRQFCREPLWRETGQGAHCPTFRRTWPDFKITWKATSRLGTHLQKTHG